MKELIQLLSDEQIYRDMAVVLVPLVGALLVYLYYRFREYSEMMVDVVKYGVYCSIHQTINAGDATDYFDSDLYLSEPRNIKAVLRWFKDELHRERRGHGSIDRIAFVEKEVGPVGAITLKDLLSWYTGTPSVVIRPGRKGPALRIKFSHAGLACTKDDQGRSAKGDSLFVRNGHPECIVLVSDVATTGTTILESVDFVERAGGQIKAAFVLYDRQEKIPAEDGSMMSAQERLNRKGIRLVSMVKSDELRQAAVNDSRVRRVAEAKGLQCGAQPVA